ncbi:NAD(P)-binding domain-containing protein [Actinoplanes sp. NPDC051861]|uniref:NAD(P)-dependent oxidoreductase n=1 Tax=Actinoplanes sp. NPDC051861 TaxID=3155170 RepID=UPI0034368AE0
MKTTFLGLGAMGGALATAALDAGYEALVWNRSARSFDGRAVVAGSAGEAVAGGGVIVVCLLDQASVHEVLDPVAAGLGGRTVVNLTTTTPKQSRELAGWAAGHGITYLDGAIMAVPEMIGGAGSAILYSGDAGAFEEHRKLLEVWGAASFHGADAGAAALHDMAMLTGMYPMFAGFLQGAAMVAVDGVSAVEFAERQVPFLAAMTGALREYAAIVDAQAYDAAGQQSLRFTETALASLIEATADQGIGDAVLGPVHDLVRRQIADGHGERGTARIFEGMRRPR